MEKEKVIIALHDEFTGKSIQDFIVRHEWKQNSEFHVTHVVEPPTPEMPGDPRWDAAVERSRKMAQSLVGEFSQVIKDRVPGSFVREHVLQGKAAAELVKLAQNQTASLIIMGCRGRKGFVRLLLGSVSAQVAHKAPCSVVILKKNHLAHAARRLPEKV